MWVVEVADCIYSCDLSGKLWVEDPENAERLTYEDATLRARFFWLAKVRPLCEAVESYEIRQSIGFPAVGLFSHPIGRAVSLYETGINSKF